MSGASLELLKLWHSGQVEIALRHDQTMDDLFLAMGHAAFDDPLYLRAKEMSAQYWNAAGELNKQIKKRERDHGRAEEVRRVL